MAKFDYGKVILYDELKFRIYREELKASQNNVGDESNSYDIAKKLQATFRDAEEKRKALFDEASINKHYGIIAQIYNSGFFGRVIASILNLF